MKYLIYLFASFLIVIFAFGILKPIGLGLIIPGLPLLFIICIAVEYASIDYLFFSFFLGIWFDILYGLPIGTFSFYYVLAGVVSMLISQRLLWVETGWKYYLLFIICSEILLLLWIWVYTTTLTHLGWWKVPLSAAQLIHFSFRFVLLNILFAFPVYALINILVSKWSRYNRESIKIK